MAFVKSYRYKIKNADLSKWKRINRESTKIYKKAGSSKSITLFKRKGKQLEIIEMGIYETKSEFLHTYAKVNKDKRIDLLFKEFLEICEGGKFIEEDFYTT